MGMKRLKFWYCFAPFFKVLLNYSFHFLIVGHKLLCQQNPDFDLRQANKGECCSATIKDLINLWYRLYLSFLYITHICPKLYVSASQIAASFPHCFPHLSQSLNLFITLRYLGILSEFLPLSFPWTSLGLYFLHSDWNSSSHHPSKKIFKTKPKTLTKEKASAFILHALAFLGGQQLGALWGYFELQE